MRNIIKVVAITTAIVCSILLMMSDGVEAHADGLVELQKVDVNYKRYTSPGNDELIYPYVHKESLNLNLDMDVLRYAYINSTVMSETDQTQFRAIGLNSHIGVRLGSAFDVEYEHYSKHILDAHSSTIPGFPLYDSVGVVIHLLPKKSTREF